MDERPEDPPAEAEGGGRKPFLLRLPPDLHRELKRWAERELRSLNAQIEFVLRDAVRRANGRRAERDPGPDGPPADEHER